MTMVGVHDDLDRDEAANQTWRTAPAAATTAERPLTEGQRRRAVGAVIGAAVGDALGAPYEFLAPAAASEEIGMVGGGILGWSPAEWTDDTAMATVILQSAAGASGPCPLMDEAVLDRIAADWFAWSHATPDIGGLTSSVMGGAATIGAADGRPIPTAADFRAAASAAAAETAMNAGNGSLMRTAAVVVASLRCDDDCLEGSVLAVSRLTHRSDDVDDACVLWSFALRRAILDGALDIRAGMARIPAERRAVWEERIREAEDSEPVSFPRNGWVVHAFQAAWSAVQRAKVVPDGKFAQRALAVQVLDSAVRSGYDTDTVACIAGSMIGALLGPKVTPSEWRRELHGWPGLDATSLERLASRAIDREHDTMAA